MVFLIRNYARYPKKNSPDALTAIYLSELGFMNSQDEFCYKISHSYFKKYNQKLKP